METTINNDDEVVIRISRNSPEVEKPQVIEDAPKRISRLQDGHRSYRRIGIEITKTKRNSFHGLTEVQTLAFGNESQHGYVLDILNNPNIKPRLPSLLHLLYEIGCSQDPEKQIFATAAIERLAQSQPFSELNSDVIMEWAKDENPAIQRNAVRALLLLIKRETLEPEILKLLNAWVTNPNPHLMETALKVYSSVAQSFPSQTLQAIEYTLARKNQPLGRVIRMVERIYALYPDLTINVLHKWLANDNVRHLNSVSRTLLITMVQIDDIVSLNHRTELMKVSNLEDKVIDMIILLWNQEESAERILRRLRQWCFGVLSKPEQEQSLYLQFFHKLYYRCGNTSRNWFAYYVTRWQKEYEHDQRQLVKFGKRVANFQTASELNFQLLIPE